VELARLGWSGVHQRKSAATVDEFLEHAATSGATGAADLNAALGLAWLSSGGWTGKTGRNRASVLRAFGDWLETAAHVAHNPFAAIRLPRATPGRGAEPFTLAELRTLLRVVRQLEETVDRRRGRHGPMRSTFYAFLALTGLRFSEAARQRWEDIDLDAGAMAVTLDKSRRRDALPLCVECVGLLQRWAWWTKGHGGGLVFPVVPCHKTLVADLERAGIARARGAWHRFRKAAIVERARRAVPGASYREVQTFARHTDPRITLGVYDRVRLDELRPIAEAMPSLFEAADDPPGLSTVRPQLGDRVDKAREGA
jgi:integrase